MSAKLKSQGNWVKKEKKERKKKTEERTTVNHKRLSLLFSAFESTRRLTQFPSYNSNVRFYSFCCILFISALDVCRFGWWGKRASCVWKRKRKKRCILLCLAYLGPTYIRIYAGKRAARYVKYDHCILARIYRREISRRRFN